MAVVAAIMVMATAISSSVVAVGAQGSAQAFLDPHNTARAEVGVVPLVWDDTVAAYAQAYAAKRRGDCALVHSGGPYGENLFWGSAGANWTAFDAVASWVEEKQYYNCSSNSCAAGQVCGHYTQVVWANTTRAGCARVTCGDDRQQAQGGGTFIVCEYDPPGNYVGERPYAGCEQVNPSAGNSAKDFLNLQNMYRAGLGVGMLSWDTTLAAYAASYANERKRDCEATPSHGPYGENVFRGVAGSGASDALNAWIGQKHYYDCSTNRCRDGEACGDYTQLAWANSTRVGCASVACFAGGTFIACSYDPPGNVPGQRPYSGCATTAADSNPPPDNGNGSIPKVNNDSPSRNSSSSQSSDKSNSAPILPIILPVVNIVLGLVPAIVVCIWRRSRLKSKRSCPTSSEDIEDLKAMLLDPDVIRAATQNFSEGNKLGKGGFGEVYKGLMPDGQEIAVKKLARDSKQGLHELKNELLLVAKLQHRNLVKLIGACLDGEKLLVYEYIPNKSLDSFIYDDKKRDELSWETRYRIICGIARGLVYLHDESRVKVIHRDLKPSNILLDMDMNPKISDFGLASVFEEDDHSKHVTRRVAGTYGYMAPEYAVLGHVSTKSDVFSFGVIVLEIVTGRRNSVSSSETVMAQHLLSYVWENWTRGTITETIDPSLRHSFAEDMVLKCTHIGLLCVQENPSDRPNMSNVILMLVGRSTTLPAPSRPAFLFRLDDNTNRSHHGGTIDRPGCSNKPNLSFNEVTITKLEPR